MTGGLIALVAALAVASALGLVLRRRAGRFRAGRVGRPRPELRVPSPVPARTC